MDSIQEVMNQVIALRIQGPNKNAAKTMRTGSVKGRSHNAQIQILFQLSQELASFSFLWFVPLAVGPCPWLSLTGLHKSSILHSRRGRVRSFQLSVGLALSYSVKPPQPGCRVGSVMKSTAIIPIRNRGQGWQWKSIIISISWSSSFSRVLTSQLPECGWSKAEESSIFCCALTSQCHVLTSQLPELLEQGSESFVGESCCLWNQTLRRFWGSRTAFQVSSSQEAAAFLTLVWWMQGMTPITLTTVGTARMTMWGPVQTGKSGSFFPSLTHISSPGW